MEKYSTTSKLVSAGAIMVLGLGISAVVLTSSANADESHAISKIHHVSKSIASTPPAMLPPSMQTPSISRMPSSGGFEEDSTGSFSGEESSED